jgi:hypothetical protein
VSIPPYDFHILPDIESSAALGMRVLVFHNCDNSEKGQKVKKMWFVFSRTVRTPFAAMSVFVFIGFQALSALPVRGMITDITGSPIAGAKVVLKEAQISTETDSSGVFEFNVNAVSFSRPYAGDCPAFELRGGRLSFTIAADEALVSVCLYGTRGEYLSAPFHGILQRGEHKLTLTSPTASSMGIVVLRIGEKRHVIKNLNLGGIPFGATPWGGGVSMAISRSANSQTTEIEDTIVVSREGYEEVVRPLTDFSPLDMIDIVMKRPFSWKIATWYSFYKGVLSITFDNPTTTQIDTIQDLVALRERPNFFTWYIDPDSVEQRMSWKKLDSLTLYAHTRNQFPIDLTRSRDEIGVGGYHAGGSFALDEAKGKVTEEVASQPCLSVAYPEGQPVAGAEDHFLTGRLYGQKHIYPGDPENLLQLKDYHFNTGSVDSLENLVQRILAVNENNRREYGWAIVTYEYWGDDIGDQLDMLHDYHTELWDVGVGVAVKYMMERNSAELYLVEETPSKVVFCLKDTLDDAIFDQQLTCQYNQYMDESWGVSSVTDFRATQNGEAIPCKITSLGRRLRFEAIPDRGLIVIEKR